METKMYTKTLILYMYTDNDINTIDTSKTSFKDNVNINENIDIDIETKAKEVSFYLKLICIKIKEKM